MAKKRQRRISVLLIPDDNAEPYSFRLNWSIARVLLVIGAVIILHLIGGAIGYVKLYNTYRENVELERSNTRLLEDNKRVYRLAAQLEDMDKDQNKIMNLLGVESRNGNRSGAGLAAAATESAAAQEEPIVSNSGSAPANETVALPVVKGNFLRARKKEEAKVSPMWPSLLPVEGYLSREFAQDALVASNSHEGIDIAAKHGSPVLAAGEGYVVYAGWHQELGNLVILHHGDDLFSTYGHNDRILVREREQVKRGETIALVGSSGRSSGPHLHFEIWHEGKAVDPLQFLLTLRDNAPETQRGNSNDNTVLR